PGVPVSFDHLSDQAIAERFALIKEHYEARLEANEAVRFGAPPYKPVPPERMFLDGAAWGKALAGHTVYRLSPFEQEGGPNIRSWR
ncbi:hypothetical protein ACO1MN_15630, partial [Staphylococcus aureus]